MKASSGVAPSETATTPAATTVGDERPLSNEEEEELMISRAIRESLATSPSASHQSPSLPLSPADLLPPPLTSSSSVEQEEAFSGSRDIRFRGEPAAAAANPAAAAPSALIGGVAFNEFRQEVECELSCVVAKELAVLEKAYDEMAAEALGNNNSSDDDDDDDDGGVGGGVNGGDESLLAATEELGRLVDAKISELNFVRQFNSRPPPPPSLLNTQLSLHPPSPPPSSSLHPTPSSLPLQDALTSETAFIAEAPLTISTTTLDPSLETTPSSLMSSFTQGASDEVALGVSLSQQPLPTADTVAAAGTLMVDVNGGGGIHAAHDDDGDNDEEDQPEEEAEGEKDEEDEGAEDNKSVVTDVSDVSEEEEDEDDDENDDEEDDDVEGVDDEKGCDESGCTVSTVAAVEGRAALTLHSSSLSSSPTSPIHQQQLHDPPEPAFPPTSPSPSSRPLPLCASSSDDHIHVRQELVSTEGGAEQEWLRKALEEEDEEEEEAGDTGCSEWMCEVCTRVNAPEDQRCVTCRFPVGSQPPKEVDNEAGVL
jgi:hypothetical protein